MRARRDVYQAIADPTRRAIIGMLAEQPQNVNAIAEQFDVSRQAISLHVKILSDCGLIFIRKEGRDHICEARLDSLSEVSVWVAVQKALGKQTGFIGKLFGTTKKRAIWKMKKAARTTVN